MFKPNVLRQCRKLVMTGLAAFAVLAPMQAMAQVRGYLSNFDVWNFSGRKANDFELFLGGIRPDMITSTYRVAFPNATLTDLGTGTLIRWTGGSVPDTGFAHFGVGITGNAQPVPVSYSWTFDGVVIWSLPPAWQGWDFYGPRRRDVIQNWGRDPIFVQRRWAIVNGPLALEDLMRNSPIWNQGILIDRRPVMVPGGEVLNFDFKLATNPDAWYVLMYDEFDASGKLVRTYLNAAQAGGPDGRPGSPKGETAKSGPTTKPATTGQSNNRAKVLP